MNLSRSQSKLESRRKNLAFFQNGLTTDFLPIDQTARAVLSQSLHALPSICFPDKNLPLLASAEVPKYNRR